MPYAIIVHLLVGEVVVKMGKHKFKTRCYLDIKIDSQPGIFCFLKSTNIMQLVV